MKPKIIETVCTGNHGRSPVAELIGRNYLREICAIGEYEAASSGTSVDAIKTSEVKTASMIRIIEIGKQREFYSPNELREIDDAIKEGDDAKLKHFYQITADIFEKEEHDNRAEALRYFGIEGVIKANSEQTIPKPDAIAVLSMAERNNDQVKIIYENSGYTPIIDVLSKFATGDRNAELPDAFGKPKDAYFEVVEALLEHVPMAIDRLIN